MAIAWRHSVFLIQDEKLPIFITGHEGQEEKLYSKAFEQTQASPPTKHALIFLRWEKLLMVKSQSNSWLDLFPQDEPILMKTKFPVYTIVFGVVNSDNKIMQLLIIPHGHGLNMEADIKSVGVVVLPWIKQVAVGRSKIRQQNCFPATQACLFKLVLRRNKYKLFVLNIKTWNHLSWRP